MASLRLLRLSASVVFTGVLISILAGLFHPDRAPANTHPAVFAEYAASDTWTLVHFGQFVGMAGVIAGLVLMSFVLEEEVGGTGWLYLSAVPFDQIGFLEQAARGGIVPNGLIDFGPLVEKNAQAATAAAVATPELTH